MALSLIEILNNPRLIQYQFATEKERKAIRLKLTLAIIEDVLKR